MLFLAVVLAIFGLAVVGFIGRRQSVQCKAFSVADGADQDFVFTVDRGTHQIRRIKLFVEGTNALTALTDALVRIQAEGEFLYNGRSTYAIGLFLPTDQANANNVNGPHVLTFDDPLVFNKSYPITVTIGNRSGGALTYVVVVEGAAVSDA